MTTVEVGSEREQEVYETAQPTKKVATAPTVRTFLDDLCISLQNYIIQSTPVPEKKNHGRTPPLSPEIGLARKLMRDIDELRPVLEEKRDKETGISYLDKEFVAYWNNGRGDGLRAVAKLVKDNFGIKATHPSYKPLYDLI